MLIRSLLSVSAAALVAVSAPIATAQSGNIVSAAASNPDFKTLVTAVRAAKLTDTLAGKGPFTVFAPTNAAFAKLPAATLETLLKPENRDQLTKILTYHVVPGRANAASIVQQISVGNGQATFTTVEGSPLIAKLEGSNVVLIDENGGKSTVTQTDLNQSNGIIHVIDTVVLPK